MTPTLAEPLVVDKGVSGFFSSPERDELLEQLHHYSRYSDLLLVLSGPNCSGKSQLLKAFTAALPADVECCTIKAQANMGASMLVGQLVRHLGGDGEPRTLWLARQFADLASRGRSLVFAIDQAELLCAEALNWLVHFQSQVQANNWPLHILLVGRSELQEKVAAIPDQAELVLPLKMAPITLPLASQFIQQLEQTLERKFPPCNDVQLKQFCKNAEGSFEQLLEQLKQHSRKKRRAMPWVSLSSWQYLLLGGAVLLLGSLVVLHALYGGSEAKDKGELPPLQEIPIPILAQPDPLTEAPAQQPEPEVPVSKPAEPVVEPPAAPPVTEKFEATVVAEAVSAPAVTPPKPSAAEQPAAAVHKPAVESEPAAIQPVAPAKPLPTQAEKTAQVAASKPEPKPASQKPVSVAAETPDASSSKPQAEAPSLAFGWEWLSRQPQDGFVLQLMGSSSEAGVQRYVDKHPGNRLLWYRSERQGKPWFVVVQGYYPSRAAAEQSAAKLSQALGVKKPWIRPVAQVLGERR